MKMSFWSAIVKAVSDKSAHKQVRAAGVLKDEEGWYYEESQNFSKSQSTVRIDQKRPGNWKTLEPSCGIVGLNQPEREKEVARFFAGSYRWLRLEREPNGFKTNNVVRVIGTYREKSGKELSVHLGYLRQELTEVLEGVDVRKLWPRIRFIRFPSPGRDSTYMIRFDLMKRGDGRRNAS
jgi:hypothetical protein